MDENPYGTNEESVQKNITAPWICPTSNIFEWWVRLKYNGETFEKQLNVSITDFQQKFLKHPYYCEDVFFNVDDDPEDDIKVSFGFYWETILNMKTNAEHTSLEDMVRVRQINGGPSDLYAGLEVWSEIHVNWGLVTDCSSNNDFLSQSTQSNQLAYSPQMIPHSIKSFSLFIQKLEQKTGPIMNIIFNRLLSY